MRKNFITLSLILISLVAASAATTLAVTKSKTAAAEEPKKAVTNKLCPVSGGPVSEKYRAEYKGQYVYVCCEGCLNEFKADPEKFVAKMSAEEREAIKTNELCPMSKEPVSKDIWTEDSGRKVYFCCAGCKAEYEKKMAAGKKS